MKTLKNKKSSVPGDLPPRIFNNDDVKFALAEPTAKIMNNVAKWGIWPNQYKTEWGVVLAKEKNPEVEKSLRIISCTNQISKCLEKVVIKWLMKYVKPYLDPDQMGGQKGQSVAHYLIEVANFILYNQDLKNPQAIISVFVDYAQGFNRVQHSKIIEISAHMKVPGWLLKIMVSYLSQRKLRVRFKGKVSEAKHIKAGTGQGCFLGLWCFLFLVNFAGPQRDPKTIGEYITETSQKREPMKVMKRKWVDDLSILVSLDLKKEAVVDPEIIKTQPTTYHNRTGHALPDSNNSMQMHINAVVEHATNTKMQISESKTKVAIFNTLHSVDIQPNITLGNNERQIKVVDEIKFLGQIITTDMKTIKNT